MITGRISFRMYYDDISRRDTIDFISRVKWTGATPEKVAILRELIEFHVGNIGK